MRARRVFVVRRVHRRGSAGDARRLRGRDVRAGAGRGRQQVPARVLRGPPVYYIQGHWWYRGGDGRWGYYREEPAALIERRRHYVDRAARAALLQRASRGSAAAGARVSAARRAGPLMTHGARFLSLSFFLPDGDADESSLRPARFARRRVDPRVGVQRVDGQPGARGPRRGRRDLHRRLDDRRREGPEPVRAVLVRVRSRIEVTTSGGASAGTFAQACGAFATTITLLPGFYSATAELVDANGNPRTTSVPIAQFTIDSGIDFVAPIDFPASSFF